MADDGEAIDPGLETAPPEQQPIEQEISTEPTGDDPAPGEGEEQFEDFEHDGKAYRVPREIHRHLMRDKDYTEKSAANARDREALTAREGEIAERAKATEAELDARADLRSVTKELEKFAALTPEDWAAHRRQDPMGTADAERYEAILRNKKAELEATLGKTANERSETAKRDFEKRVQDTLAAAPKIIGSGYKGAETITKLAKFLNEEIGVPDSVITSNWSPEMLKLAHFASLGAEALKRPAAKTQVPPAPALTTVTTKSNPAPQALRDDISTEEWVRRRNAQIKKRAS